MTRHMNRVAIALAVAFLAVTPAALAHIQVNSPNGGEQIQAGSVFTVEWIVVVGHSTENWDVWYSTTGGDGPWIEVALDLPAGDISIGSIHTYQWTIPDTISDQVRIRVVQDNVGNGDYEDISNGDFSIVPGISLEQTELIRGEQASFLVSSAEYNETVHFLYSLSGAGMGPQVDLLGGLQLDLNAPISIIGQTRADRSGQALLQVTIPRNIPGFDAVWTQAVIRRGVDGESSIKSNWNQAPIN